MTKHKMDLSQSQVFILGDGVFAKELKAYFELCGRAIPVLVPQSDMDWYQKITKTHLIWTILGSGHPDVKRRMAKEAKGNFASFFHLRSTLCVDHQSIGKGTVIAPGAVVAPNVSIGKHVLLNYNSTVGHDTIIGDFSVVSPNAAVGGTCKLGEGVYVGAGATIKEGLTIADNVTIGMGAAVIKDITEAGVTVVGVPARIME